MSELHVSVRELVAFSFPGEDITPVSRTAMREGALGHRAWQAAMPEGWEAEHPLTLTLPVSDELTMALSGRMDAWLNGDTPQIKELKLWRGRSGPEAAYPEHWAQAVIYGHMVCALDNRDAVTISIVYVSSGGKTRGLFTRTMTRDEAAQEFDALYQPFARWQRRLQSHQRARDESLNALGFPFEKYRAGQREMAVQAYYAISHKLRLFAAMPTGTGKSAATLFPALKAMGKGLTGKIFYLTARTTARQAALQAVELMRRQPMRLWVLTLNAKEKQCPHWTRCHPDDCPRAKGHYLRLQDALTEMLDCQDWTGDAVREMADKHMLCPFEFALSLTEIADVVICDYNYALDPAAHIQRVFDTGRNITLLIDEAHNLLGRTREMLSGTACRSDVRRLRTAVGKAAGRADPFYKALTRYLARWKDMPAAEGERLTALPDDFSEDTQNVLQELIGAFGRQDAMGAINGELGEFYKTFAGFARAVLLPKEQCAYIMEGGSAQRLTVFALDVREHLRGATAGLSGTVCFSATFEPLEDMRLLLGGEEADGVFRAPSPFDPAHLEIRRYRVNTRYQARRQTAPEIAGAIARCAKERPGKYICFFPSFQYMQLVAELLPEMNVLRQDRGMDDAARESFLEAFTADDVPVLGLCVLGGVFAEGIDLPGTALVGVMIVGVGLPMVNIYQETLKAYYESTFQQGFLYAYQIPGMQKVSQAVGRVIRTEEDKGVALLMDDRYFQRGYERLCPPHWRLGER